jgi:hypothetical protein
MSKSDTTHVYKKFTLCEFIQEHLPEYYCTSMTSSKVLNVLAYCAGDYKNCPIYRQKAGMHE